MNHKKQLSTSKVFFSVFLTLFLSTIFAQVNPDFANIKVKTRTEIIYQSTNKSSSELKSIKSAIDSKGTRYVLFNDAYAGTVYLSTQKNGNWKTEIVSEVNEADPANSIQTQYLAMDIDKNDGLHIILVGHPNIMYYGYRAAGARNWTFTELSKKKTPHLKKFYVFANLMDMAVDKNGGVHVAIFTDVDYGNSSMYFYKTPSGKWSNEIVRLGIKNTKKDYGTDPSIIVSNNKVMMTFGGGWTLSYAEKTIGSSEWKVEEILNEEQDYEPPKMITNITLSPKGLPVISFREYNTNGFRGVNVLSKSECDKKWIRSQVKDEATSGNSIAVDKYGVFWLAYCNDGDFTKLAYRSCNADRSWKNVIKINDRSRIFMDMFMDENNHVHLLYSTFEDEIKHVEAWFDGDPEIDNNILPVVTSKMKPQIKTGQFWKTTLKAFDPECDKIKFYSDDLPDGFTLTDHKNGLATIRSGVINEISKIKFKVYVVDSYNDYTNAPKSGIDITLSVSPRGDVKGSYRIIYQEGKPFRKNWVNLNSETQNIERVEEEKINKSNSDAANKVIKKEVTTENNNAVSDSECKEYLDRFEAWADEYIKYRNKLKKNPMDFKAVAKIAEMSTVIGNWAMEWQQKHTCSNDPAFMKRYEKINDRIQDAN